MNQALRIGETTIPVRFFKGGPALRLKWASDGILEIFCPHNLPDARLQEFILARQNWLLKHEKQFSLRAAKIQGFWSEVQAGRALMAGVYWPFYTKLAKKPFAKLEQDGLRIDATPSQLSLFPKNMLFFLEGACWLLLVDRVFHWAKLTGEEVNKVRIKNQSGKWGSCSSQRNLNLNWRLGLLPPAVCDYVIVHELMHLREMNHSADFWKEVERYCPDYQTQRSHLRQWEWTFGLNPAAPVDG